MTCPICDGASGPCPVCDPEQYAEVEAAGMFTPSESYEQFARKIAGSNADGAGESPRYGFGGGGGVQCPETRQTFYPTQYHAKIARQKARRKGKKFEPHSVKCEHCGGYHNVPSFEWPKIAADSKGRVICVDTGKLCFDSEDAATAARKRARRQGSETERSIRSYLCPFCDLWHNTSRE